MQRQESAAPSPSSMTSAVIRRKPGLANAKAAASAPASARLRTSGKQPQPDQPDQHDGRDEAQEARHDRQLEVDAAGQHRRCEDEAVQRRPHLGALELRQELDRVEVAQRQREIEREVEMVVAVVFKRAPEQGRVGRVTGEAACRVRDREEDDDHGADGEPGGGLPLRVTAVAPAGCRASPRSRRSSCGRARLA